MENARFYMTEHNVSRSLGLVLVQTCESLAAETGSLLQTAKHLGIKVALYFTISNGINSTKCILKLI